MLLHHNQHQCKSTRNHWIMIQLNPQLLTGEDSPQCVVSRLKQDKMDVYAVNLVLWLNNGPNIIKITILNFISSYWDRR